MHTAIVTDSTADIPTELVTQHQIHVIPAILVIEGVSVEDGGGISREEFYERMPHMQTPPTTSTPSIGAFQNIYEKLIQEGVQKIISLHVASPLSGICNTAKSAAQTFGQHVRVIDSGQLSMGLGFQVLAVAEAVAKNLSFERILSHLRDVRRRIRVLAMLDTLEHVHRSGRVSWITARLSSLLRVKPFVEVKDGQVLNLGQARTRRKGIAHLVSLAEKLGPVEKLAILHSNAEAEAQQLLADLKIALPVSVPIVNITPVIGTHVGPNGLGIAAVIQ
jgi:DegV family protein with EDD domain